MREKTIFNGFLYSVVRDRETSYHLVKKYRIKNWDRIERGISTTDQKGLVLIG